MQLVNFEKSEIIFSKGTNSEVKRNIANIIPMQIKDHFSKYLGMPTFVGKSKNLVFNFIQDKIWKKLKGWKKRNLSFAGRGTLIKAVAQAIPTYLMSSFLIPKNICDKREKMICNFGGVVPLIIGKFIGSSGKICALRKLWCNGVQRFKSLQ
jgi:hypothetical protein